MTMWFGILRLKTWYKLHKWTSIVVGVVLLMWLVTAMTMSRRHLIEPPIGLEVVSPDYRLAKLTPSDIGSKVSNLEGEGAAITSLEMKPLLDRIVYVAVLDNGHTILLDAASGEQIEITVELATDIAIRAYGSESSVRSVERLDRNSVGYPYGPVPAYEVSFNDGRNSRVIVTIRTGEARETDDYDLALTLVNSLHAFDALRVFTDRGRLITGLLVLASIITLLIPILGYYLALPRRWQKLNRSRHTD